MHLIAATSLSEWLLVILQVGLGLGTVIFVHELGHFAVAKMCGVKCDKFFIGFDIGGYKISRKWGETEYGIGILPLGGYVKMLGQDDNPGNIAEQMKESQAPAGSEIETKEILGPDGSTLTVDRRSYLAKSVPQRMAIISAGVIMNVIFAFVFAAVAFGLGVPYIPCIISDTSPGSAAYQQGFRPGDEIVAVGDVKAPSFSELMGGVTLGDLKNGVPFTVRRAATGKKETIVLKPEQQDDQLAKVGIFAPHSLRLRNENPFEKHTPAANASEPFLGGDEIIAINGQTVIDPREYTAQLVEHLGDPVEITVRRGGKAPEANRFGPRIGGQEITIKVDAQPMRGLGLVMKMGPIVAVEQNSPAWEKGIRAGDMIEQVIIGDDSGPGNAHPDQRFSDPVALPEQLRRLAKDTAEVRLIVGRSSTGENGRRTTVTIDLPLRQATWIEIPRLLNDPLSIPALGIAYRAGNQVDRIIPGSPAARVGLQGGDVILQAETVFPKKKNGGSEPFKFGGSGNYNWPAFVQSLQKLPDDAQTKLTYQRDGTKHHVLLAPEILTDHFLPHRGFLFAHAKRVRLARSVGEQIQLGYKETVNSLGMVVRFLGKLGTQIPLNQLGGPVTIAQAAGYSAFEGMGKLLVFLTMLSANLAVINFLPIPLLDGGHMVFLAWEGVYGKPASERFVIAMHTLGFVFVIGLMLFVIGLDISRLIG
ncbi:MAG: site-2 protease family protein [Pirellulales bacterium]|nr:site-2 protease family protein [Pirellulales bacterium]